MARDEVKSASVAWATREEIPKAVERALRENAGADRVGPESNSRAMTLADAARLVDPAYAKAAAHAARLRDEAGAIEGSRAHHAELLRQYRAAGEKRWQEIGLLRQVLHKSGVHRDPWISVNENNARQVAAALDGLEPRRAAVARQLPAAERAEAVALARATPAAAAELARRQERAGLARATLQQWWQQDLARERTAWEREWSLGRGWEIRR